MASTTAASQTRRIPSSTHPDTHRRAKRNGARPREAKAAFHGDREYLLKRKRPRPLLNSSDRLFWVLLRQCWSSWKSVLIVVKPDTVVGWHRAGFRWYWRWKCRRRQGRPRITTEIRELIMRLAAENTGWGAPKIHGELLKLGFDVSERTVARYLRRIHRACAP